MSMKLGVSQKGAVSVYGLRRFPITLYASEWKKILEKKEDLLDFIERNEERLTTEKFSSRELNLEEF